MHDMSNLLIFCLKLVKCMYYCHYNKIYAIQYMQNTTHQLTVKVCKIDRPVTQNV